MVDAGLHGRVPSHLVRELAGTLGEAASLDEVVRAALGAVTRVPGVVRAGIALNRVGGRQLQFVSSDPGMLEPRVRWCLIDAFDKVPLNDAVLSGEDVLLHGLADLDDKYPDIAPRQRTLGTRSMAALALSAGSQCLGGLMLAFDREHPFDTETLHLLECLATQVTQALRRDAMQLMPGSTAEALQRSLMPTVPEVEGLEVSARYHPGGLTGQVIGGDWYDVFDVPGGETVVVVGDVMGKGATAAILMGEVRTALRAYAMIDTAPAAVLGMLDRFVSGRIEPDHLVTLVYGVVSADRRRLAITAAGHPPPMLVRREGPPERLEKALGPALGFGAGPWASAVVPLSEGDTLFTFSDGLVHGRDIDLFAGMERLAEHIAALPERRRRPRDLCGEARRAMSDIVNEDDVTVLAVSCMPEVTTRRASLALSVDARAAREARGFVRDVLADWAVGEDAVEATQLCVSELVTNAVIHGGVDKGLTLELDDDGWLTALVHDSGGTGAVEHLVDEDFSLVSGRGLTLVEAVSDSWGTESSQDGTTVWCELRVVAEDARQRSDV